MGIEVDVGPLEGLSSKVILVELAEQSERLVAA
jgi:hypothetical protein